MGMVWYMYGYGMCMVWYRMVWYGGAGLLNQTHIAVWQFSGTSSFSPAEIVIGFRNGGSGSDMLVHKK